MVLVLLFFFFVVFSYSSRLICDKTIIKLVVRVSETSRKVCKVQTHKSSEVQTLKILSNPPTIHSPDEFSTHHLMILNGHIQPRVPEVIQGRGANCAKGASRAPEASRGQLGRIVQKRHFAMICYYNSLLILAQSKYKILVP